MTKAQIIERLEPLIQAGEYDCPGVLTDFQLRESFPVYLSVTVKELRDLAEISRPNLRNDIARAELKALTEPPTSS